LIDPEADPGGVCLYRGCIPSKALLHVAALINETAAAEKIGLAYARPEIDIDKVRGWKNDIITKLTSALGSKVGKLKVNHIRGLARFADADAIIVTDSDGKETRLSFDQAILATGSRPLTLQYDGEAAERIIDSTGALELKRVPDSLLVVGGGYIGLELGSVYAALG
ncbi:MAG: FAD-dependent oxidoreductase, partial [Desulfuromonadales bacterium]|nr:FAD-dependent oxidoreductase [Desulfuromonadales bacterium]NIS39819.1 FAD-dependent oxidoreductase [Desulfuromonadales bacterium]